MPIIRSGGGAQWTVEYAVDFAGDHNFTSTVTKSLGGVTWTAENHGNADAFALTSSGLEITAKDGFDWWSTDNDQPLIAAKITDMMSSYSERDTVCLQLHATTNRDVDSNYEAYALGIWDGNLGSAEGWLLARRYHSAAPYNSSLRGASNDAATGDQPSFFEIVLSPANGAVASVAVWPGSFPRPLTSGGIYQSYSSLTSGPAGPGGTSSSVPTWGIPLADARFLITSGRDNPSTALTMTSIKMRVLRRTI